MAATPRPPEHDPRPSEAASSAPQPLNRRRALRVLGALATAASAAALAKAERAAADANVTVAGASTPNYGINVAPLGFTPPSCPDRQTGRPRKH
jgi:hypothetical protein